MSRSPQLKELQESYLNKNPPRCAIGDTVCVQMRITEGDKERLQAFTGTVIAKKGTGLSETFTLYRTAYGSSMERVFMVHSPRIASVQVVRSGRVRRAKLYYLRGKSGKATKLREMFVGAEQAQAPVSQEPLVDQSGTV